MTARADARLPFALHLAVFLLSLATSLYCMFAYIPFIWHHFIRFHHFAWITWFVKLHPLATLALLGGALWRLRAHLQAAWREPGVAVPAGAVALWTLGLLARPLLSDLGNDGWSLFWALACWLPYGALLALSVRLTPADWTWAEEEDAAEELRGAVAAGRWALFSAAAWAGAGLTRAALADAGFAPLETGVAALWTGLQHAVLAAAAWAAWSLLRAAAAAAGRPPRAEALLSGAVLFAAVAALWERLVLELIPFGGPAAWAHAAAVAAGICAFWAAECRSRAAGRLRSGLAFWTAPAAAAFGWADKPALRGAVLAALLAAIALLSARLPRFDWNGVLLTVSVAALWALGFAVLWTFTPAPAAGPRRQAAVWAACLLVTLAYRGAEAARPAFNRVLAARQTRVRAVLEALEGWDPSFKLSRRLLSRPRPVEQADLFGFLARHTNVPRTAKVQAPDVRLGDLAARKGPRPHVFVMVVDSLRQDYLGAYDPAVRFTPRIDAFARDAVVFRRAFTRYGATGLSQPSIWTGTAMFHQQYLQPFAPLNALEKLLRADGYHALVTRDSILSVITQEGPRMENLEPGRLDRNFMFCTSVQNALARLDRGGLSGPAFVYTQPQDVHVSVINSQNRSVVEGEPGDYRGFDAPYASRVRRLDRCFGELVDGLRRRGLYDDSIVVLTADHGDSLGEGGRWGHAYTLFPEILRIPLIVRLPPALRGLYRDPEATAFSMDLAPTLYALLGHGPPKNDPIHGRPLFTAARAEHDAYLRERYLLASSYGPVYAVLSGDASSLYIADGVNLRRHHFDLARDPEGRRNILTAEVQAAMDPVIRAEIERVAAFYGYRP